MPIKLDTRNKIVQAIEELYTSGNLQPTIEDVLKYLGKGSKSTIAPVLREWSQEKELESKFTKEMPQELKNYHELSISKMWSMSYSLAKESFDAERLKLSGEIETIREDATLAREDVERLESDNAKLAEDMEAMSRCKSESDQQIHALQEKLIESQNEVKILQSRLADKEKDMLDFKTMILEHNKRYIPTGDDSEEPHHVEEVEPATATEAESDITQQRGDDSEEPPHVQEVEPVTATEAETDFTQHRGDDSEELSQDSAL